MTTKIYPFFLCVLLAGCENAGPGGRPGPYVKPGLVMIPADQAPLYGLALPVEHHEAPISACPSSVRTLATDVRSVQTESAITAVQYNRYADPARPNELMHEAHVVYRREGPPRWRLQPAAADQQILIGPQLTEGRGEVKPLASQELDGYLRDQRANLEKQQQVIGQVTEGMRQLAQQQQQIAKELAALRAGSSTTPREEGKEGVGELTAGPAATPAPKAAVGP